MKALFVTAAILASSFIGNLHASENSKIKEKIKEVVIFEKGVLPIKKGDTEFVRVCLKLSSEGKVKVLDMNYSDEIIMVELLNKLAEIEIVEESDTTEVYNYNFTFKKY